MTLVFFIGLLGDVCTFHIFGIRIALDKANVPYKSPASRPEHIRSRIPFSDHFGSLGPMLRFVVLDSNIFARTQFSRGGPWSLRLILYPPPSAKVLLELLIRDSVICLAWTRYVCPLEPPERPLSGCQSIVARTILVFRQRFLERLHMSIRLPKQIFYLSDSTFSLSIALMVVGARHFMNDVIIAAPAGEFLVLEAWTSVGPYMCRFAICSDPVLEYR